MFIIHLDISLCLCIIVYLIGIPSNLILLFHCNNMRLHSVGKISFVQKVLEHFFSTSSILSTSFMSLMIFNINTSFSTLIY